MNEFKTCGFIYIYLYTKQHDSKKGEKYILMRLDSVCACDGSTGQKSWFPRN